MALRDKPSECFSCPLFSKEMSSGFLDFEGHAQLSMAIFAEAGGESEAEDSLPLREDAPSGSIVQRLIDKSPFKREQFLLGNICMCRPANNELDGRWFEFPAANHCRTHMDPVVQREKVKVIFALGNVPLRHLTPFTGKSGKKQKGQSVSALRGFILPSSRYPGVVVIPTFHPAYLRRGKMGLLPLCASDFNLATEVALGKFTDFDLDPRPDERMLLNPTEEEARRWVERALALGGPIGHDCETDYSYGKEDYDLLGKAGDEDEEEELENVDPDPLKGRRIVMDQFSTPEGEIAIMLSEKSRVWVEKVLREGQLFLGWNCWDFDDSRYEENMLSVPKKSYDLMWLYHHRFPDLPAGLQSASAHLRVARFPWKHMGQSAPAFYGVMDVRVLHPIYQKLRPEMEKIKWNVPGAMSLWEGYERWVAGLWPIMKQAARHGIPISQEKLTELDGEIEKVKEDVGGEIQKLIPVEILKRKPLKTRTKKVLEEMDKEIPPWWDGIEPLEIGGSRWVREVHDELVDSKVDCPHLSDPGHPWGGPQCKCKGTGIVATKKKGIVTEKPCERVDEDGHPWGAKSKCQKCKGKLKVKGPKVQERVERLAKLVPFNPGSRDQLISYMKFRKHPIPKNIKGKGKEETSKDSAAEEGLKQLFEKTKDPFYDLVIKRHKATHVQANFVRKWRPNSSGRLQYTPNFRPASGQKATTNPNVLNAIGPKAGEWGEKFRRCIEAPEGYVLISVDLAGLHSRTTGFEAEDKGYYRLSNLGLHDFVAAHMAISYHKKRGEKAPDELNDLEKWLELEDNELIPRLGWVKKNYSMLRNKQAKPCSHSWQFKVSERKIFELNKDVFESRYEVRDIFNILGGNFKGVPLWQQAVLDEAEMNGRLSPLDDQQTPYLITRGGYIRFFPALWDFRQIGPRYEQKWGDKLFTSSKNGKTYVRRHGPDQEPCVAMRPSNDGHVILAETQIDLGAEETERGLIYPDDSDLVRWGFFLPVHDDMNYLCPEKLADECIEKTIKAMGKERKWLINSIAPNGVTCKAEASVGRNWAKFNDDPTKGPLNLNGMKGVV